MPQISILVIDDHPALRAGLHGLFEDELGMTLVGTAADEREMREALRISAPEVVIMDYALGRGDGLSACFRLKQRRDPPAVILYSGYVDTIFAVPAAVAQADAIVAKSAPVRELLEAIRGVAGGEHRLPQPDPELMQAASARLHASELPVLGMLRARVPVGEIAETLGATPAEVRGRALRILADMQAVDRVAQRLEAGAEAALG